MTMRTLTSSLVFGCFLQATSINAACSDSDWQSADSLPDANRAATVLVKDDCTIWNLGGSDETGIVSIDASASSPTWSSYTTSTSNAVSLFWPSTRGGDFMRYSDGSVDESVVYLSCDNDETGYVVKYDVDQDSYSTVTTDMPTTAQDCCVFAYEDAVYVIGGQTTSRRRMQGGGGGGGGSGGGSSGSSGTSLDSIQIYNVTTDTWSEGATMNTAREDHGCAIVIEDGSASIYIVGGAAGESVLSSVEKYDIEDDTWTEYSGVLDPARRGAGPVWIEGTDYIVIAGGDICYDGESCGNDGDNMLGNTDVFVMSDGTIDSTLSSYIPDLTLPVMAGMFTYVDNMACGIDDGNTTFTFYVSGGEYATDVDPTDATYTFCYDLDSTTVLSTSTSGGSDSGSGTTTLSTTESTEPVTSVGGDNDGSNTDSASNLMAMISLVMVVLVFVFGM